MKAGESQVAWEKLRQTLILSVSEGGHSRVGEIPEAELLFCMFLYLHFECKDEIKKMMEEIVVLYSKVSVPEHIVEQEMKCGG